MKITTVPKTVSQLANQLEGIADLLDITELATKAMDLNNERHSWEGVTLIECLHTAAFALQNARQIVGDANTKELRQKQRARNSKYAHHRKSYYARTRAAEGKSPTAACLGYEAYFEAQPAADVGVEKQEGLPALAGIRNDA